jgi:murein DD-endopeptidase MepM/ murein hydrolase activator NlpD
MAIPDFKPRSALRRSFLSDQPVVERRSQPSVITPARVAQRVAGLAAFFSSLAWHITGDLTRTGFARLISHVTILGVTVGALALSSGVAELGPEPGANISLRAAASVDLPVSDYALYAAGGSLLYQQSDIVRQADPYTIIPDRPRRGVIEYTVQTGDTLFGIANRFGVSPESILWNNEETLKNEAGNVDPHKILPGTLLVIPPVSGVLHIVQEGDTLESIAEAYKVTVDAIVVDAAQWNNLLEGRLPPAGSSLIVPGGQREFKGWALPKATRSVASGAAAPALGLCANVAGGGLQGSGSFMWPSNSHWVSGYNYSAWHPGVDLAGRPGDPAVAADNGFVVYAGWSNVGYGNLVVIDHANGWQTWYAHLSQIYVTCGQDVWKGSTIGAIGSTGNSSGPHLHFETRYQGDLPNPWNVLPPP